MKSFFLIDVVWRVLEHLNDDAFDFPYMLQTERDYQSEIYRRLVNAYEAMGLALYRAEFSDDNEFYPAWFSRLGANHGVRYGKGQRRMFPDLVIYADLEDCRDIPSDDWAWPIAFAMEIKYATRKADVDSDVLKLVDLLDTGHVEQTCALSVEPRRDLNEGSVEWVPHRKRGDRLYTAHFRVPSV